MSTFFIVCAFLLPVSLLCALIWHTVYLKNNAYQRYVDQEIDRLHR